MKVTYWPEELSIPVVAEGERVAVQVDDLVQVPRAGVDHELRAVVHLERVVVAELGEGRVVAVARFQVDVFGRRDRSHCLQFGDVR